VRAVYGRSPVEQIRRQIEKIVAGAMILDPLSMILAGDIDPVTGVVTLDRPSAIFAQSRVSIAEAKIERKVEDLVRSVLIDDTPGLKPNQYQCTMCREIFDKEPEDEALAELELEFPGFTPTECGLVCDDCFKMVMGE